MSFIFTKSLSKSITSLHKVPFYNFARNVKTKPIKFDSIVTPNFKTGSRTDSNFTESNKWSKDFGQNENERVSNTQKRKQARMVDDRAELTENKILQMEILRTETVDSLLSFYEEHKANLDLINICTCFNRAVKLTSKTNNSSLIKRREIKEMIDYLRLNIHKMNDFSISNYLSNLAKLNVLDNAIVDQLIKRTIQNNIHHNEKALTYITWALGKLKIKNDQFLDLVTKRITQSV